MFFSFNLRSFISQQLTNNYLLLSLIILLTPLSLFSEAKTIYDISFDYKILNKTKNGYIEVESANSRKLLKQSDLDRFLVKSNFSSNSTKIKFSELKKFTEQAIAAKDQFAVEAAVSKVLSLRFITTAESFEYFGLFNDYWLEKVARLDQLKIDYQLSKQHSAGKVYLFKAAPYYSKEFIGQCCSFLNLSETFAYFIDRKSVV